MKEGDQHWETSRLLHERSLEHVKDAESFNPKSHIMNQWVHEHPDRLEMPPFSFNTTYQFKDCLFRQIGQALKIHYSKDVLLNSKSEYIMNCLTRLTIEEFSWEKNERERLEDVAEVKEQEAISRFREKVETHLAAKDIILNILDHATKTKKHTRPPQGWKSLHTNCQEWE